MPGTHHRQIIMVYSKGFTLWRSQRAEGGVGWGGRGISSEVPSGPRLTSHPNCADLRDLRARMKELSRVLRWQLNLLPASGAPVLTPTGLN